MHSRGVSSHAKIVTTAAGLQDLLADLEGEAAIGIDTEFMRERTYRAELCLLQLTTRRGPMCVDPLALPDLAPLRAALGAAGPPKVLHAGRQDLEVLAPIAGATAPLFDTQIAAALAGHTRRRWATRNSCGACSATRCRRARPAPTGRAVRSAPSRSWRAGTRAGCGC